LSAALAAGDPASNRTASQGSYFTLDRNNMTFRRSSWSWPRNMAGNYPLNVSS